MSGASDTLENWIVNHFFRNSAVSAPTAWYAALFTTAPGDDGTGGVEVTGGSYARKAITFGAPSGGVASNTAALDFAGMPACTVRAVGIYTASSGGTYLGGNTITARAVTAGKTFTISLGDLVITVS